MVGGELGHNSNLPQEKKAFGSYVTLRNTYDVDQGSSDADTDRFNPDRM